MGAIIFAGAVVGFFATCAALVRKGNSPEVRLKLCGLQTVFVAAALLLAIPKQPETDVGRFTAAIQKRLDDRLAQRLEVNLADAR